MYTIASMLMLLFACLNLFSQFTIVTISGNSMSPTYKAGTWHLADKNISDIQHGDVIVFKIGDATYVKRVVAMEKDEIPVCYGIDEGKLYATIVPMASVWLKLPHEWISIPEDYVWVEGDANSNISIGSGHMGLVNKNNIIAKMNYTDVPKNFWYLSVVNQSTRPKPKKILKELK
jgi:signal peptidase I